MDGNQKEFVKIFQRLSVRHSPHNVWRDFIFTSAAAISNRLDKRPGVWHGRENEYLRTIKRYDRNERYDIPELLALTAVSLQNDPAQDFLGKLFMELELSNHWKGQFFTPYSVAEMMARITADDGVRLKEAILRAGYASVNDPACGSGVMLIAFASYCRELGIDPSKEILFAGQDIDETVALMCYIQLSLLNCAGLVSIGNTLTEPVGGRGKEKIWLTPAYVLKFPQSVN